MSKRKLGPLYIALAAVFWSLGGLGAKYIPWHPLSIACVRGTMAALTIILLRRSFKVNLTWPTAATSLCMFATTILFMFANKMTTAANAIVLQYTAPVYVLVASILLAKKRPRKMDIITVSLTFAGIALFFVDHLGHGAITGDILALLSGTTFAGVFFFNSLPGAHPQDASFLGCLLSSTLLPFLLTDTAAVQSGAFPWAVAIFMGIFQLGFAYFFFAKGVRETGAVTSSIICTAEPILNPIWVFLAVGERPGTLAIAGAVIVVLTICFYNVQNARQAVN